MIKHKDKKNGVVKSYHHGPRSEHSFDLKLVTKFPIGEYVTIKTLLEGSTGTDNIYLNGSDLACKQKSTDFHLRRYGEFAETDSYTLRLSVFQRMDPTMSHQRITLGDLYDDPSNIADSHLSDEQNKKFLKISDNRLFLNSSQLNQLPLCVPNGPIIVCKQQKQYHIAPGSLFCCVKVTANDSTKVQIDLDITLKLIFSTEKRDSTYSTRVPM
jgi:hypothetical protein